MAIYVEMECKERCDTCIEFKLNKHGYWYVAYAPGYVYGNHRLRRLSVTEEIIWHLRGWVDKEWEMIGALDPLVLEKQSSKEVIEEWKKNLREDRENARRRRL